jgi:hypothetical protein
VDSRSRSFSVHIISSSALSLPRGDKGLKVAYVLLQSTSLCALWVSRFSRSRTRALPSPVSRLPPRAFSPLRRSYPPFRSPRAAIRWIPSELNRSSRVPPSCSLSCGTVSSAHQDSDARSWVRVFCPVCPLRSDSLLSPLPARPALYPRCRSLSYPSRTRCHVQQGRIRPASHARGMSHRDLFNTPPGV